jgi:hypothetical protein
MAMDLGQTLAACADIRPNMPPKSVRMRQPSLRTEGLLYLGKLILC